MRDRLITDLLHHLDMDESLKIGYADPKTTKTLEALNIPIGLKRLLQWSWITHSGHVGRYFLNSVNEIPSDNDYDKLIEHHMIPIGSAVNGDILVIRINDERCSIGLVSHDELWENGVAIYAEVAASIDEYLWRVTERRYLPIDFHAASELEELRRETTSQYLPNIQ